MLIMPPTRSGMGGKTAGSLWSLLIIALIAMACGGAFLWVWREAIRITGN